jgi:hypothetical protein
LIRPRCGALRSGRVTAILDVVANGDGRGLAYVEGTLYAQDAAALEQRVAQLAGGGVRTIRAPLISVAPMRWVRWRPVCRSAGVWLR